jgi:DNA helicase II / ATP-dependent DNA helicase PcrA
MFDEKYSNLNDRQKEAVDAIDGPVLVVAGPGSGKTELLSLRTLNILKKTDLPPSSILCLTFTDSAAINMQNRLAGMIGAEAYKIAVSTFHSFGTEIINRYPEYFYKGVNYQPIDDLTAVEILEDVLRSLPHDNPLGSFSEEHGYAFLKDIKSKIGELKKGGLSPEKFELILKNNKNFLEKANIFISDFFINYSFRDSKKEKVEIMLNIFAELIENLRNIPVGDGGFVPGYPFLKDVVLEKMESAHGESAKECRLSPLSYWKKIALDRNAEGHFVIYDSLRLDKHFALAKVYSLYQKELHKRGYFDYDDMILDVCDAMEKNSALKFNLQEQYQYVLVDEFQDTNGAQIRLLKNLLDAEVHEGSPNILAVGDDDQAIYKFQGANLENILGFKQNFRNPHVVVLTKNYRSTQEILNFIRKIIRTGKDRLEDRWDEVIKELEACNKNIIGGEIQSYSFSTEFEEFMFIANEVKNRIESGEAPEEIAILGRKHKHLEEIAKYFDYMEIPFSYERKRNIFQQKHILEIINILKFLDFISNSALNEADALLPEILSYEFFGVSRYDIWQIATETYGNQGKERKKFWLDIMKKYPNEKVQKIADFFIHLAGFAKDWTGEEMIDCITGIKPVLLESEEEYVSPYKNFYFGEDVFENDRHKFMDFLSALRAFVDKVRNFRGGKEVVTVSQLVEFANLHEKHKLPLIYSTSFDGSEKAVNLRTVHNAKGLEFETVYVIGCYDKTWFGKGGPNKIKFPSNVLLSASDEDDDVLRLFYVALSRAKKNLYLTRHEYKDDGSGLLNLRFLSEKDLEEKPSSISKDKIIETNNDLAQKMGAKAFHDIKFNPVKVVRHSDHENALLRKMLENYKLSATHLNNFLNIESAGPSVFLERNLLKFPQKITSSLAFGNAVHNALEKLQREFINTSKIPSVNFLLDMFDEFLSWQRLGKTDFEKMKEKGHSILKVYYEERKDSFDLTDRVELNFKGQNVVVNGAKLTGKIDKIKFLNPDDVTHKKEVKIFDLKTGKPFQFWDSKVKSRNYKDQLLFYKLLIENSRDFNNYVMTEGFIEFVQPLDGKIILLPYQMTEAEIEEMKKLVEIVYNKILNLDFPDVSRYAKNEDKFTSASVKEFRVDLLEGRI